MSTTPSSSNHANSRTSSCASESRQGKRDILACDYVGKKVRFKLPEWSKWREHMDYHIFHLSYRRLDNSSPWFGAEHPVVLQEFQAAWKVFLSHLPSRLATEFEEQIAQKLRQVSPVQDLVLR